MHRMSRFPEKLKIQSCGNSTESCVHYICTECLDWQKNWMSRDGKMQWKIVYVIYLRNFGICNICTIYVRKVWICRKVQYPKLCKFNGKLSTLYMYRMSGLVKKSNVQNCVNSTGNCVHYMYRVSRCVRNLNIQNYKNSMANCVHYICTKRMDLQKIWISRTA